MLYMNTILHLIQQARRINKSVTAVCRRFPQLTSSDLSQVIAPSICALRSSSLAW